MTKSSTTGTTCSACRHFTNDPAELERVLTGILILSSTYGSTRGSAGICGVTGRFHDPVAACSDFADRKDVSPDGRVLLPEGNDHRGTAGGDGR